MADKDKAIEQLSLDLENTTLDQHTGDIETIDALAVKLKDCNIRFVVMDIPPYCSYLIPKGCINMFTTQAFTESILWYA